MPSTPHSVLCRGGQIAGSGRRTVFTACGGLGGGGKIEVCLIFVSQGWGSVQFLRRCRRDARRTRRWDGGCGTGAGSPGAVVRCLPYSSALAPSPSACSACIPAFICGKTFLNPRRHNVRRGPDRNPNRSLRSGSQPDRPHAVRAASDAARATGPVRRSSQIPTWICCHRSSPATSPC